MFEYKAKVDDQAVVLRFKPYGDAPGRISRRNIGRIETQVWLYLEWGLAEPKHWPPGSDNPGDDIFDEIPQRDITNCYNAWQAADIGDEDDDIES